MLTDYLVDNLSFLVYPSMECYVVEQHLCVLLARLVGCPETYLKLNVKMLTKVVSAHVNDIHSWLSGLVRDICPPNCYGDATRKW